MLKFKGQLDTLDFDLDSYTKTFDKVSGQVVREASRNWFRFLISRVPVEVGMAKSALLPLGRFLKNVPTGLSPKRRPYYSKLYEELHSPSAGEKRSEFAVWDDRNGPDFVYGLIWETSVLHFWLAEFYNGPALPGEDLLAMAEGVFVSYFETTLARRIPEVAEFLTTFSGGVQTSNG